MALKAVYDTKEDIPEQFVELFTERDGKWELTEVEGIKTTADTDRLQSALTKERSDHKETKDKLKAFGDSSPEKIEELTTQVTELETERDQLKLQVDAGAGKEFDQEKWDEALGKAVAAKVATETAPLKRDLDKVTKERDELATANQEFQQKETNRTISDAVRSAASGSKIIDSAMDDVLMLGERVFEITDDGQVVTRDNVGVTPGIAPDVWLSEMQDKRPHWWPTSQGGGANGSGGGGGFADNPFSRDHWNLTKQGEMVRTDPKKAERMAQAAGTSVGGGMPKAPAQQQQQQQ